MQYAELLAEVESRARIPVAEEARTVTEAVLRTLVSPMSPDNSHPLYQSMPTSLKPVAGATPPHLSTDVDELVGTVAMATACSAERVRYYVEAVFSALADHEPEIAGIGSSGLVG